MNLYDQMVALKKAQAVGYTRAAMEPNNFSPYGLALETWRAPNTLQTLGNVAGTPAGAFGLTPGDFGASPSMIVGEAASGVSKTDHMRRAYPLPVEYVPGGNITVIVSCRETVGPATVATTIDCDVFKYDKAGGVVGTNLVASDAQAVTTTEAKYEFIVTPTGLVTGDVLDIQISGITNDTGGTVGTILEILDVQLRLDVQG